MLAAAYAGRPEQPAKGLAEFEHALSIGAGRRCDYRILVIIMMQAVHAAREMGPMNGTLLRRPTALIPLAMSAAALAIVIVHAVRFGTAREVDEGTAAHLWQLLMAGQLPLIAVFAATWLGVKPRQALRVLVLQAGARPRRGVSGVVVALVAGAARAPEISGAAGRAPRRRRPPAPCPTSAARPCRLRRRCASSSIVRTLRLRMMNWPSTITDSMSDGWPLWIHADTMRPAGTRWARRVSSDDEVGLLPDLERAERALPAARPARRPAWRPRACLPAAAARPGFASSREIRSVSSATRITSNRSLVLLSVPFAIGQPAARSAGIGGMTPRFAAIAAWCDTMVPVRPSSAMSASST